MLIFNKLVSEKKRQNYMKLIIAFLLCLSCSHESEINLIEQKFLTEGLVEIQKYNSDIKVDLVNSDSNKNFFGTDFYNGLKKCYVREELTIKLSRASKILKGINQSYSLMVYDGARPRSVSQQMFNPLKNTPLKKYVADPKFGSMHNYGAAVDVVIVDKNYDEIDMGLNPFRKNKLQLTKMLYDMKKKKTLTVEQKNNRMLLKKVMTKAEFYPIEIEWWHFEVDKKDNIRKKYRIIE